MHFASVRSEFTAIVRLVEAVFGECRRDRMLKNDSMLLNLLLFELTGRRY